MSDSLLKHADGSGAYSVRKAQNGLTVLKVPRAGTEAVMVSFLFRAGSRYEDTTTNGLAHFNEHMAFKGGEKFPDFGSVSQAFDRIGAINNAFTGAEVTGFWAKVRAEHAPQALDVLSDVLTKTAYDPAELDKERGVIIEEINMYEDDPASLLYMVLEEAMFPDHPLGRSTLGPKENIKRFTPDDFRQYERTHQTPDRGLLILAGKTDGLTDELVDEYVNRFEGQSGLSADPFKVTQSAPVLKVRHKPTEQTHLGLSLRGPSMHEDKPSTVLRVLAQVLGGTMSSRLFVEVREKRGLAYYVRAMPDQYADTGALVMTAGVTREKSQDAMSAILNEVKRLAAGELTEDELAMHKDSIKGRLTLRWEDSMALADFYGEQVLLLDEVKTTEQVMQEISEISVEDIVSLTKELAADSKLTAAVIGPHQPDEYQDILTLN